MRTRTVVVVSVAIVLVLAAASTVAIGATRGHRETVAYAPRSSSRTNCSAPNLPGTVVNVTLGNAGGPMMGGMMNGAAGGMMRLTAAPATIRPGQVSFIATNTGTVNHEFVILPLAANQIVGTRALEGDGTIDETGSLGEASNSCGAGSGDGIAPGASSWVTVTLAAGRYELVCNLAGHYAAGMSAQLTVR